MTREWQQTKMTEYVMPNAVYYQSIWAVRDLERMEKRLTELKETEGHGRKSVSVVCDDRTGYRVSRPSESKALELLVLEERVKGIREAMSMVPEMYRPYIISNIVRQNSGVSFPNNMWRIWKQRFLFNVAKNLSILE